MNRFQQFLDNTPRQPKKQKQEQDVSVNRSIEQTSKSVSSIKVYQDTLVDLSVLKLFMNKKNYASVIEKLIEQYLSELTEEQRQMIAFLKETVQ